MALDHVIERSDFDALFGALARRGYTVVGPTVRDQRDRLRRDRRGRRSAGRLDRRAGRRPLPARAPRRRGAVRLRRRPALVEALPAAGRGAACGARGVDERRRARSTSASRRGRRRGTRSRRALVRAARDGHPRPGPARRLAPGSRRSRPARRTCSSSRSSAAQAGGTCFCVSMNTGPVGRARLRPRADRGARRRRATTSCVEVGSRARRGGARRGAARARRAGASATRPAPSTRAPRRRWAASSTRPRSGSCCTATTSTRAGTRSPSAA